MEETSSKPWLPLLLLIVMLIETYWSKSSHCWLFSVWLWPCYLQLVLITRLMAPGQGPRTHSQYFNCLGTRIDYEYESIPIVLETHFCLILVSFTDSGSTLHVPKNTNTGYPRIDLYFNIKFKVSIVYFAKLFPPCSRCFPTIISIGWFIFYLHSRTKKIVSIDV